MNAPFQYLPPLPKHCSIVAIIVLMFLHPRLFGTPDLPNYADDIAPLIRENCLACHSTNGIGPFALIDYESVRKRSRQISEVLEDKFMPPWMPAHGFGPPLKDSRILSEKQINVFIKWHKNGALPGDLSTIPPLPERSDSWSYGEPDLVIEMPEPFILSSDGGDQFRNFVIPIPTNTVRNLKAIEFLPETRLAIHHVVIAFDPTRASRQMDAADPGPGFESMDLGAARRPIGHLIGWAPGQVPYEFHEGTFFPLQANTDLVVQLHMLPTGKEAIISPKIGFYFTDEKPSKKSMVIQLRADDIDIPAGETEYEIEQEFELPAKIQVLSIFPHAHFLGKDMRISAQLPDGTEQWLLRIPDWDFNWQSDYRYKEPLSLPKGSKIIMRYSYDNSEDNIRNPSSPPKRVQLGQNSYDEMGEVAIQVLLEEPTDWAIIQEAQSRYNLKAAPGAPIFLYELAAALTAQNREEEAIDTYLEILQTQPRSLEARIHLAGLYLDSQDTFQARKTLKEILILNPTNSNARQRLAQLESKSGNASKGIGILLVGLKHHHDSANYRYMLGKMYLDTGDNKNASKHLKIAAEIWDAEDATQAADAYYNLAITAMGNGHFLEMEQFLQNAIRANGQHGFSRLMAAAIALQSERADAASEHIRTLISLNGSTVPKDEQIFDMLPFPVGHQILAKALIDAKETTRAAKALDWAIVKSTPATRTAFENLKRSLSAN